VNAYRVAIASIMSQQFTFDEAPEVPVELEATLTLRPKRGLRMVGSKRAAA
jgi:hypothetical protein